MFWVAIGMAYMLFVTFQHGTDPGIDWLRGYLLEWMLSIENLGLFHHIFKVHQTPQCFMHKALFFAISGASMMRLLAFMLLSNLLRTCPWIRVGFGVLLIYSGIQATRPEELDEEPRTLRVVRRFLGDRLIEEYDPQGRVAKFDVKSGKYKITMNAMIILFCEVTDLLLSVDTVSAKIAQIPDLYLCYSSSVIAMFGARSAYFLARDLFEIFDLLKYGLCFILVFIGLGLMFSEHIHLPSCVVLTVIFGTFSVCMVASIAKKAKSGGLSTDLM